MTTNGIQQLIITTHNWGLESAFWTQLGYRIEFDTGHNSGQLRHPGGGPTLFIAEVPQDATTGLTPVLEIPAEEDFTTPPSGSLARDFETTHWGSREALLRGPDGAVYSVQTPVTASGH